MWVADTVNDKNVKQLALEKKRNLDKTFEEEIKKRNASQGFLKPTEMNSETYISSVYGIEINEIEEEEIEDDQPWILQVIIFAVDSLFSKICHVLYLIASLLSGYFYMYLLVVADQMEWYSDETRNNIERVELYMEIFFLFNLVKNFITDYYPEGS
jgi:hypothetical protein